MPLINQYEVELKVTNPATRVARIVRRGEHAYSAMDAVMQAVINQRSGDASSTDVVDVLHVGPPAAAVLAATSELSRRIAGLVERACARKQR